MNTYIFLLLIFLFVRNEWFRFFVSLHPTYPLLLLSMYVCVYLNFVSKYLLLIRLFFQSAFFSCSCSPIHNFHSWSYDTAGQLIHIRNEKQRERKKIYPNNNGTSIEEKVKKNQFVFVRFILQSVILGFQRFKVKQFNKTLQKIFVSFHFASSSSLFLYLFFLVQFYVKRDFLFGPCNVYFSSVLFSSLLFCFSLCMTDECLFSMYFPLRIKTEIKD